MSSRKHRGRTYLPYAFTEQGVAMLSSVLRSPRAVEVNIAIMRTFVQLRRLMDSNRDLARKIEAMERKYDEQFAAVFEAIKQLVAEDRAVKAQPQRRDVPVHRQELCDDIGDNNRVALLQSRVPVPHLNPALFAVPLPDPPASKAAEPVQPPAVPASAAKVKKPTKSRARGRRQ